jgi:hypothetical protein
MTADFWTLTAVLTVTLLVCTVIGFVVHPLYGVANLIPASLIYGWAIWTQYCLRAGNCRTVAWITVAGWTVYAVLIITVMSVILWVTRKAKREGHHRGNPLRRLQHDNDHGERRRDDEHRRDDERRRDDEHRRDKDRD